MYTIPEKVIARLSNYEDDFDTLIEDLIRQVTAKINSYCSRDFSHKTNTNEIHDGLNGYGNPVSAIFLKNFPIESVTSVEFRSQKAETDSWLAYTTYDYDIDSDAGILTLVGGTFPGERRNIRVTYISGYKIDFDNESDSALHTLPADITLAATELVVRYFNRREKAGMTTENSGGGSNSFTEGMDKDVAEMLDKYRKIDFV